MKLFLPLIGKFPYPSDATDVFKVCQNVLDDMTTRDATTGEFTRILGPRPVRKPYWFVAGRAPPYSAFVVGGVDFADRQYMSLTPDKIAVRLPKGKPIEFPQIGEVIPIIMRGTGRVVSTYVNAIDLPTTTRPRTGILQVTYVDSLLN